MTATLRTRVPGPVPPGDRPQSRPRPPKSRRWIRLVLPSAVVLALVLLSVLAYLLQQPDQRNAAYLSPMSSAGRGADRLAGLLRTAGITVERQTRTSDALVSAYGGNATLFVPTPDLMHPFYLRMLKLMPPTTRIVLVDPADGTLADGLLPIAVLHRHLAARTAAPDCGLAAARAAGAAGTRRSVFGPVDTTIAKETTRCYGGSLVVLDRGGTELTVVGAADPFRNDRIGEAGNAKLAVGLLSGRPRVVWLDLHRKEPQPGYVDDPQLANQAPAPPSLGPGTPDPDFPLRETSHPKQNQPQPQPPDDDSAGPSLQDAFPPWLSAVAALLALAVVLLALARARRLGAPVTEPLPVAVRATETVTGRGRLYQRAKARTPALRTLQAAARERLNRMLDLPTGADRAAVTSAAAAAAGWPVDDVDATLFGTEPATDDELVAAAQRLEALMKALTIGEQR